MAAVRIQPSTDPARRSRIARAPRPLTSISFEIEMRIARGDFRNEAGEVVDLEKDYSIAAAAEHPVDKRSVHTFESFTLSDIVTDEPVPRSVSAFANVPLGIEEMIDLDYLKVTEERSPYLGPDQEDIIRKFAILDRKNRLVFKAELDMAQCCASNDRPYDWIIYDDIGNHVMHFKLMAKLAKVVFEVSSSTGGIKFGTVEYNSMAFSQPKYKIKNSDGTHLLSIIGISKGFSLGGGSVEPRFRYENPLDKKQFVEGKIAKEWTQQEMFRGVSRSFCVSFDDEADSTMKAMLLGAGFLISSNHYE